MNALPYPTRGGSIRELRKFVNAASDDDFNLMVGWLVAALRPGYPYPICVTNGEQGSAKSTTNRVLRDCVDPNKAGLRRPPRERRDLMVAALNGHVVSLDNLSRLPEWLADDLCSLATGAGFSARQLYSDSDEIIFTAQRPILLNGIPTVADRSDIADRALAFTLPVISDERRQTEEDFWHNGEN